VSGALIGALKGMAERIAGDRIGRIEFEDESKQIADEKAHQNAIALSTRAPDGFVNRTGGFAAPWVDQGPQNTFLERAGSAVASLAAGPMSLVMKRQVPVVDPVSIVGGSSVFLPYRASDAQTFSVSFNSLGRLLSIGISLICMLYSTLPILQWFGPIATSAVVCCYLLSALLITRLITVQYRYRDGDMLVEYTRLEAVQWDELADQDRPPEHRDLPATDYPCLIKYRATGVVALDLRSTVARFVGFTHVLGAVSDILNGNLNWKIRPFTDTRMISWQVVSYLLSMAGPMKGLEFSDIATKFIRMAENYAVLGLDLGVSVNPDGAVHCVRRDSAVFAAHLLWSTTALVPAPLNDQTRTLMF
jgi:hypothetical protein